MDERYNSVMPEQGPEQLPPDEQAKYRSLISEASERLPSNIHFAYVPTESWSEFGIDDPRIERIHFDELVERLSAGSGAIGIGVHGRDTTSTEAPADNPKRNVELTETSKSNVEGGIKLWNALSNTGREVTYITSGRTHIAKLGVFRRLEEAFKAPDNGSGQRGNPIGYLLEAEAEVNGLTPENFSQKLEAATAELDEEGRTRFAKTILGEDATAEDIEHAKRTCIEDFSHYPQITEADLMSELAEQAGVPPEHLYLENRSWDTITQFVWLRKWVEQNGAKDLIVVIGEDQLPRAAVLSAKLFQGVDVNVSLVGCDPRLEEGEFPDSFTRENISLQAGANWLDEVLVNHPDTWSIMRRLYRHPSHNNPTSKNAGYRTYQMTQRHPDKEDFGVR
jgi:hypothetical protein